MLGFTVAKCKREIVLINERNKVILQGDTVSLERDNYNLE